ncbi:hypothetical protein E2C01_065847 [Portunus trituberculatus]|uniref:Uncharacterized protein n=1 Tax=Portunus trituberculatus TaxID=210409 RepID=A0A5B7HSA9_PORTR|nr:hypothetical protein [Portunus trituberculatus]
MTSPSDEPGHDLQAGPLRRCRPGATEAKREAPNVPRACDGSVSWAGEDSSPPQTGVPKRRVMRGGNAQLTVPTPSPLYVQANPSKLFKAEALNAPAIKNHREFLPASVPKVLFSVPRRRGQITVRPRKTTQTDGAGSPARWPAEDT